MHEHVVMLMHEYLSSPTRHVCLGDISEGLGTRVRTFKPSSEAFPAVGECTNHLHHVHYFGITIQIS